MDSYSVKICLLCAVFVFGVNSFSVNQERKTLKERKRLALPKVICSSQRIEAVFGSHVKGNVKAKDPTGAVIPVPENDESCGVKLSTYKNQSVVFLSKYDSCFTTFKDRTVVIPLHVQLTGEGQWYRVNVSCPLVNRLSKKTPSPPSLPSECEGPKNLRVVCGQQKSPEISSEDCLKLGCCYDHRDKTCFYKLNSCSLDRHFVFSVTAEDIDYQITSIKNLIVKDHPHCVPVIATSDTAVFKIGQKECGVTMMEVNETEVYEVEVTDGTDSSLSLQVTCEYEPSEIKRAAEFKSLFMVTNPPPAVALGNVDVQMRIARDASFTSFFAEDELPVTLPLREIAHVEISIVEPSPDPALSLRVRDCFAYPATKHSVWNLLHDGCPNLLDDMHSSIPVDNEGMIAFHSQVRRFDVRTFAFLDPHTGHHSTEPVYFYCWVEICTHNMECAQKCSITSSEGERKRREALHTSDNLHLISLGPLQLGQNHTDVEDNPCLKYKKMYEVTIYVLSAVFAALLLIALCTAIKSISRCLKIQAHADDVEENTEQSQ